MADLTITPANVKPVGAAAQTKYVVVGEAVVQGEVVYLNSSDNKHYKADADTSEATSKAVGIVLTPAAQDGYALVQTNGTITPGATMTKGELYCVSATTGKIAPFSDLDSGDWICFLGVASSTSVLVLQPQPKGVQI